MSIGVGLDCGGSATRWVAIDDTSRVLAAGTGPGLSGLLFTPEQQQQFKRTMAALCADIVQAGITADAVAAGVTGLSDNSPEAKIFTKAMSQGLGLPLQRSATFDDATMGYLTAFEPGEGILVYSGTGSFAIHLDSQSKVYRAGGYGAVIDDGGSGYWIGQQALQWLVRRAEGVPPLSSSILADKLHDHIGGEEWAVIRRYAYSDTRANVASLSHPVAASATAGDTDAIDILSRAAGELARLVKALIEHVGPKPIALTGGGASSHPIIRQAFAREIALIITDPAPISGERQTPAIAAAKQAHLLLRGSH
ncbi:MAG: N-acetylglucosamine kinase [Alphaproteobacteria bacterium]